MPEYKAPGIYVVEEDTGAHPIQPVGTSTAGFVGEAPVATARPAEAVAVNDWSQFLRIFGPPGEAAKSAKGNVLANAVYGFFLNGGSRCYIVNAATSFDLKKALELLSVIDEIAIIAAPGRTTKADYLALIAAAETTKDRVAVLDGPSQADAQALVNGAPPPPTSETDAGASKGKARPIEGPPGSERGYGAYYFPWLTVSDALTGEEVTMPPSGHVAGIYARTDAERGVHKAPANAIVRGAINVTQQIARADQEVLNPAGVNCLRMFSGEGVKVWGARTLATESSPWRYLNVRRLFNMIEESIAESTGWVVFEPNDATLWKSIRRDVGAFLTLLWRQGALQGATPQEAFFVKCDAETNTQDDINAGRVVTVIGIAPVKPAEFVIFRIGQSAGATSVAAA